MNLYYDNIVYDLQAIGGISTYWYELSRRFLSSPEVNLKFYETKSRNNNMLRRKLDLPHGAVALSRNGTMLLERFRRLDDWNFDAPGIFHSSYFRVPAKNRMVKVVSTIHDFTHDLYFSGPRVWLHNFAKSRTIHESDTIITVSECTKRDLIRLYPDVDENKVQVIYNGVSDDFKQDDTIAVPERLSLLYVGARDKYKNFRFAVQVAAALPEAYLDIVGAPLSASEQIFLDAKLKGRYQLHTHVSSTELNQLYNQAACLLYPSSYEGFGIPLLEAMRAGCPFLALDRSSIPEVAGNAGFLLSALDLNEAKEAITTMMNSRALFSERGQQQSLKFSWDKCFHETDQLYKSIL
jgi:mannosyltransferase